MNKEVESVNVVEEKVLKGYTNKEVKAIFKEVVADLPIELSLGKVIGEAEITDIVEEDNKIKVIYSTLVEDRKGKLDVNEFMEKVIVNNKELVEYIVKKVG